MAKMRFSGLSDRGKVRTSNEDAIGLFPEMNLFLVADGMGGHAGGEVASRMAIELIRESFRKDMQASAVPPPPERLQKAIKLANQKIYETGKQNPSLSGMGTTVVCALLHGDTVYVAYVGDSRAYRITRDEITQMTYDHSLVYEYIKSGAMTPEEAERHPLKHVLSRALGTSPDVEADVLTVKPEGGDILLLCSDGLSNTVPDKSIFQQLRSKDGDLESACHSLIQEANNQGGIDNITVALLEYVEDSADSSA